MQCSWCKAELTTADGISGVCRKCSGESPATPVGWQCPSCGRCNAPWKGQCDCHPAAISSSGTDTTVSR